MRKLGTLLLLVLLLTGCAQQQELENVLDAYAPQPMPKMQYVHIELPEEAAQAVMETDSDVKLYVCQDYTLTMYTVEAGDLQKTVKNATGFSPEALQMIKTQWGGETRYQFVWTAAGEGENMVGRACILDDGNYHYVLTVTAPESKAGMMAQAVWQPLVDSFHVTEEPIVNTGS